MFTAIILAACLDHGDKIPSRPSCGCERGRYCSCVGKCECPKPAQADPYTAACAKAVFENKPLVVFVGCPVREIKGMVTVQVSSLFENTKSRVIVASPIYWLADLPATATDAQIRATLNQRRAVFTGSLPAGGNGANTRISATPLSASRSRC